MQHSIVEYMADQEGYRCGYCGSPDSNFSHGMWAHSLTCQDYQDLIDRGWRRSGKYVYKPTMDKMCCPLYTIRCHAPSFKISKSQKKVLKKATKFFTMGEKGGGGGCGQKEGGEQDGAVGGGVDAKEREGGHQEHPRPQTQPKLSAEEAESLQEGNIGQGSEGQSGEVKQRSEERVPSPDGGVCEGRTQSEGKKTSSHGDLTLDKHKKIPKPGLGADPAKPPSKKAKLQRLERRQERLARRLQNTETGSPPPETGQRSKVECSAKPLEELLIESVPGQELKHKLEIKLVRSSPMSEEFRQTFDTSFEVYKKYQMSIHNDPETKCTPKQFKRFLVDSPLEKLHSEDGPECGYGSFHQHYLLDGKIIAVGVVDILPTCVSSVYFYYDPAYRFLTLGTYSALREIGFVRLLQVTAPSIEYYYMGFYVHSCRKMRYKGQYYPSYLLCPEAYIFHPIEECIPKLDVNKYSRFSQPDATDPAISLGEVFILYKHVAMIYQVYKQHRPQVTDEEEVREYAQMAGKKCAQRMLLYRH